MPVLGFFITPKVQNQLINIALRLVKGQLRNYTKDRITNDDQDKRTTTPSPVSHSTSTTTTPDGTITTTTIQTIPYDPNHGHIYNSYYNTMFVTPPAILPHPNVDLTSPLPDIPPPEVLAPFL